DGFAGRRVDDRQALVHAQQMDERVVLVGVSAGWHYRIGEIRAVEPGDDRRRRVKLELGDDVLADVRRRRGGERDRRRPTERFAHLRDTQITRPEIVAPLADAVRLVDGEQRDAGVAEPLGGRARVEAFGRDVEQLDVAADGACQAIRDL